jgi:hypothetical protein
MSLQQLALALVLLAFATDAGLAPSLKPHKQLDPDDVVRFTKSLYKDLGNTWNNATAVADKYRDRFDALNKTTDGQLSQTLASLFEIRMLDLQASVRRAKKMRTVVESFAEKPGPSLSI